MRRKKILRVVLISIIASLAIWVCISSFFQLQVIELRCTTLKNNTVESDELFLGHPFVEDHGVVLAPLNTLLKLGIDARYDLLQQKIAMTIHGVPYEFQIGKQQYTIGRQVALLPAPPRLLSVFFIEGKRTLELKPYLPLAPLARAAGWRLHRSK